MRYCITMERVQRRAVYFDADNDDQAYKKAEELHDMATAADFEQGTAEHDYSLCDDSGRIILDWK